MPTSGLGKSSSNAGKEKPSGGPAAENAVSNLSFSIAGVQQDMATENPLKRSSGSNAISQSGATKASSPPKDRLYLRLVPFILLVSICYKFIDNRLFGFLVMVNRGKSE